MCVLYLCSETLVQAGQHAVADGVVDSLDQSLQLLFALREPAGNCAGFRSRSSLGSAGGLLFGKLFYDRAVCFHWLFVFTCVRFRLLLLLCIDCETPSWKKDVYYLSACSILDAIKKITTERELKPTLFFYAVFKII